MLTRQENELLTLVEGDAPMGQYMRENCWIPCALSTQLEPYAAPHKVTLLGRNYVAFRSTDGRIGFLDEACPHRGTSMALARNEGDGLRCIFHAWKFNAGGQCTEAPTQSTKPAEFCAKVKYNAYPVFEGGGVVWVWLGKAKAPPPPMLPFINNPKARVLMTSSTTECNWLQGVEATVDSVHVGTLHKSWVEQHVRRVGAGNVGMTMDAPPKYEVEQTTYGMRAAALRKMPDGKTYFRLSEYYMPFVSLVPGIEPDSGSIFITVPVNNTRHMILFGQWSESRDIVLSDCLVTLPGAKHDLHDFVHLKGDRSNNWGQDRTLMAAGHSTGFGESVIHEDVVVQVSMGPIVDRSKEMLSESDVGVVQARRLLLRALRDQAEGRTPIGSALGEIDSSRLHPTTAVLEPGVRWQDHRVEETAAA